MFYMFMDLHRKTYLILLSYEFALFLVCINWGEK